MGYNASVSISYGYNFGSGSFYAGVGANVSASLGPLFVGGGVNTTFTQGQIIHSWGASVGIGFQDKNGKGSLGLSLGYGSGGFTYGINGTYNNPGARSAIAKYQQEQQMKRIEEMNQKLYELLEKSGVSFASTNSSDWSKKVSEILDGLGFSASVQESILKLGRLTQKGDFKGLLHYMKSTKGMDRFLGASGKGLGTLSLISSGYTYFDNPTTANLVSFFLNGVSMTGGPISSTLYSAYSLSPLSNYVNQQIGSYINQGCNCNAGYNVYQGIYNLANPKAQHNEIFKGQ